MNNEEFIKFVEQSFESRLTVLNNPKKSRMAAGETDRLSQFKRMAAIRKCSLASAAVDLCTKQFTDIVDMANGTHPMAGDFDYMGELVRDVQNYLDLMLACMVDESFGSPKVRES